MFVLFLAVDLPFFFSNLSKVFTGGWVPLMIAGVLFTLMTTWKRGWFLLTNPMNTQSFPYPLKLFVKQIAETNPSRNDETAVFMTSAEDMVPATLVRLVERTRVLPRRLVLFTVRTMRIPIVEDDDAIEIREYPEGCYGVTAKLGFMEPPRMPHFLELCARKGLDLDIHKVFFYLSRITIETTGQTKLAPWRKILFAIMYRNARSGVSYYHLPPDRVVELGRLIDL
jgi:KUP system potassium uptake protein